MSKSAIERLRQLINNSEQKGAKIKFTVDMEEKEKDGLSGLSIDVWGARNPSPASSITTEPPHRDKDLLEAPGSSKIIPRMEKDEDAEKVQENIIPPYSDPTISDHEEEVQSGLDLTIGGEMPYFNESQGEEQRRQNYPLRKKFYDINPACDRDVSMWSVGDNVSPLAEIDGNSSPRDLKDNMLTFPGNIQESGIESEANGMETLSQSLVAARKTKMIIAIYQTQRWSYRTLRNLAILPIWTCWHGGFTFTPKNGCVLNLMSLLFTIPIY